MRLDIYKTLILVAVSIFGTFALTAQTVTTITSSTTWTVPVGVTSVKIEAWGGGGGGGASLYGAGGGGGGGAYSTATWNVTPGESYTVTIGSGGNGGTLLAVQGQNGFSSSISGNAGTLTAVGGSGGAAGIGSISGITITNVNGSGGSGGAGDFNGGNGATASTASGSGGGGAGNAGAGGAGTTSAAGTGGAGSPSQSPYFGGNGGLRVSSNSAGSGGSIPGGGGSGARSWSNVITRNGGNGARGQIVLTYTPNVCTNSTLTLTSGAATDQQSLCNGITLANITYSLSGDGAGASATGLPSGVNGVYNGGVFTISGTPTESGVFNYSVITSGTPSPCLEDTATGIITVYDAPGQNGEESAILDSSVVWTVPDGVTSVSVEAWGGGGAGGGAELTFLGIGGGGGGGAYALKNDISVTPYQSLTVVVAQPSSGVAAGNGPDGGFSTISGWENEIYAAGGKGGRRSVFLSPYPNGGEGGKASDSKGDCTADGSAGLNGFRVTAAIPPPVPTPADGAGGKGATANGGQGGTPVGEFIGDGNPGNIPGGGGSGSRSSATLTLNTTGGTGAAGRVVIWYQCPEITDAGVIGSDETICYQTVPSAISGVSDATASAGLVDYQWQSSVLSGIDGFADIASATSTSFSPDTLYQTTWYRRMAKPRCSSDWPASGISNVIEIAVRAPFVPGEILSDGEELCSGADASQIGSATPASGGDEAISYQWQYSVTGDFTDAVDITDATETFYDPGVLTSSISYRRLAKDGTCAGFEPSTGIWNVVVHPASVGGSVSGGGVVCYGVNSTPLSLTGHTGDPQTWQWSVNGYDWTDIPGASSSSYTAQNLTTNTWFRVIVKSGTCPSDSSAPDSVLMNSNFKISGFAKYENNPQTPLDGLKISLKKDGSLLNTQITGASGYYEFPGLINGNYSLEIQSAHPSGQWQTWGGVTNTDALMVQRHISNVAPLSSNPPVIRIAASVKESHPVINNADYVAIRQAAKFGWGSPVPWFDIPKWVFSASDQSASLTSINLNCADVNLNIKGLCAGDVNGTFVPGTGYKSAESELVLEHSGMLPLSSEIRFPVRSTGNFILGAVTLFLDYDPTVLEISGVSLPVDGMEQPDFRADNGTLYIGWSSAEALQVTENLPVLIIHARLIKPEHLKGESIGKEIIRFNLSKNLVSELADENGQVLSGALLSVSDAGEKYNAGNITTMNLYPNPVKDNLQVEYLLEDESQVRIVLVDLQGVVRISAEPGLKPAGWNSEKIDASRLTPGIYFLKLITGDSEQVRKVIVR